jgi:hypothetical protein
MVTSILKISLAVSNMLNDPPDFESLRLEGGLKPPLLTKYHT